jgi:hypothetical protein
MHEEMHANAETEEQQQRPDADKVRPVFGDEVEAAHGEEDQQDHVRARGEESTPVSSMIHTILPRCAQRRCAI